MDNSAERQRRRRQRLKEAGLTRVEVWVSDLQAVYAIQDIAASKTVHYIPPLERERLIEKYKPMDNE